MSREFFDAIRAGDRARVEHMLSSDAALLEAHDENGLSGYIVARYSRQEDIARLLLERGAALDIFAACMAGVSSRVLELLGAQPDLIRACSHDGWTPLHLASFFGHKEIAEMLLAHGADANARSSNNMRNTPLHAAAANRQLEVATVLLAHGAEVNASQSGGWTPLHAAAQNGDAALVRLLIAVGADVQARAENHQGALDLALGKGHQAVVDALEEHGAKLE